MARDHVLLGVVCCESLGFHAQHFMAFRSQDSCRTAPEFTVSGVTAQESLNLRLLLRFGLNAECLPTLKFQILHPRCLEF